tara:strand:+ start:1377 stop:1835 length:459 start_codon:yes stop_codon:yes gene_type:complete
MYVTEAMIQSMEEMMRNASDMEKSIKMMMESEGRMHGIELDRRHGARDMWKQLMDHMSNASAQSSMMTEMSDPMMHTHSDGMEHSHPGGDDEHHHHEDGTMHNHDGGDMQHTHDDGAPSSVEPAPMTEGMSEAEQVAEERRAAHAQEDNEEK